MVRTWDGLGDRGGVERSRTVQLLNALSPVKFGSRHIKSGQRQIQIRHGVKPGQYRGGLVHSESATRSRDLVPATGNKVAHAITEREAPEAREAGDQNNCCKVRH